MSNNNGTKSEAPGTKHEAPSTKHQAPSRVRPLAPITMILFALNLSVFALMLGGVGGAGGWNTDYLLNWGANYAPLTMHGEWWRLVTCIFVHGGVLHIAFNLWILWQVGRLLEFLVGSIGFLVLYLASGLCGSAAGLLFHPYAVTQGASGALFGLVGGLIALLLLNRDRLHVHGLRKLRNNLLVFLGLNVVLGLVIEQIDLLGHTVGLCVGFVFGLLLLQRSPTCVRWSKCRRAAVVGGAAVVLLGSLAFFLPQAPPDFYQELDDFTAVEQSCLRRYNAAQRQVAEGEIRQRVFLELVDVQLLPKWRSAGRKMLAIDQYPSQLQSLKPKMDAYILTRQQSWELLVEALRHDNKRRMALHRAQWSAAEQLARELSVQE